MIVIDSSPFLPIIASYLSTTCFQNLTQKDLATKICEKPQIVNEYESGKALPNQAILAKMERVLELKLRGKDKGAPLAPKAPKGGAK